jgi:hypothetical protein
VSGLVAPVCLTPCTDAPVRRRRTKALEPLFGRTHNRFIGDDRQCRREIDRRLPGHGASPKSTQQAVHVTVQNACGGTSVYECEADPATTSCTGLLLQFRRSGQVGEKARACAVRTSTDYSGAGIEEV